MSDGTRTCENCARALTGRQRRWCGDYCRKQGYRDQASFVNASRNTPKPATVRRQWLAQFDGLEFEPWESAKMEDIAELVATRALLQSIPDPSLAVVREIRQHTQVIRQALDSIRWPEGYDSQQASDFGRAMARRRWSTRG